MLNELIFLAHIVLMCGALGGAFLYGKGALEVLLCLQLIIANVFVTKEIIILGIATTCSEVFIVGSMYGFALLREQKGIAYARRVIWYSFYCLLFFLVMTQFHLLYTSCAGSVVDSAFVGILQYAPRLFFASLVAYLVSERAHLVFQRLTSLFLPESFARPLAVMCGQLVDTLVFGGIGLYGVVSSLWHVTFFSMIIKSIVIWAAAPFITFVTQFKTWKNA